MSTPIKKNLLITPGGFGILSSTISQIDFKWYESGLGTFLFSRSSFDLRSSIYNWFDNEEPVLLFGGMGSISSVRYFMGPYVDYVGAFSGISTEPYIKFYPIRGKITTRELSLTASLFDASGGAGSTGQILSSTSAGVSWISSQSLVLLTDTQIAFGNGSNVISGISTFVYWRNKVGIGTQYPTAQLDVGGDVSISGITTSIALSGEGRLLTNLNASNLTSGTVSASRVSGTYAGITSVGNLDQLSVSGITTLAFVYLRGSLRDVNYSLGAYGQVLTSTGAGAAWSSVTSTGVTTGTVGADQIAFGQGNNALSGVSTFSYWQNKVGIGTVFPSSLLDVRGDVSTTGITTSIAFSGEGRLITNLNASNLALGTVPTARVAGSYSGITSVGNLDQLSVSGITSLSAIYLRGSVRDLLNSQGSLGQILVSTGTGVAWSSLASTGVTTGAVADTQIAFGNGNNSLLGVSTFVYWRNFVGIGTVFPTVLLDVRGDVNISGVTTSSFSGDGRLLTNLNASNLALGTVPTARISGTYAGISSVGDLAQLSVSGITSLSAVYLRGSVRDINNSQGILGQILSSTGTGVAWSSVASTGVTTGTVGADQIAFGQGNNALLGISTFSYWRNKVGIGTVFPTVLLDIRGDVNITGVTTSAFSGDGRLLTTINADNLASGTVPTTRISGTYAGISSVGDLAQLSVSGITSLSAVYLRGSVKDLLNSQGTYGQILSSTGTGVAWSSVASTGVTTGIVGADQVAFGQGNNSLLGISTFVYWRNKLGVGTIFPNALLDVRGDVSTTGITTSISFSGEGSLLTNLNASNLALGTIPTGRVTGTYAGISSVGDLSQLSVSGITSLSAVYLRGSVRDLLNSPGIYRQILSSTGTGVAWSSIASIGVTTGTIGADQVAFGQGNNALLGVSTFVYWQNKLGVGTIFPNALLDLRGDIYTNNILLNGSVGRFIGLTTNSGPLLIFGSDSSTGDGYILTLRGGRTTFSEATGGNVFIHGGLGDNAGSVILAHTGLTAMGLVGVGGTNPSQLLDVFGNTRIRGALFDYNNTQGTFGQILSSKGTGIAWSSVASIGIVTGSGGSTQIAYWGINNSLSGISTFVYSSNGFVGLGVANPLYFLDIRGGVGVSNSNQLLHLSNSDGTNIRIARNASISTTSSTFITLSEILMNSNTMVSLEGKINGWASTTAHEAGSFFAVFYHAGIAVTQVSSVDISSKFTGSNSNFNITGLGNTIYIQVKAGTGTTWSWRTSYDYLVSVN